MLYLDTVIKLVLGLLALLVVTRLLGKKEMGQFTPFDFVYALILGALLEESLYDDKISVFQMLFAVLVWGILIYLVEVLAVKSTPFRKIIKGEPSIIVKDGRLDVLAMKKNHIEMEQLRTMMREQGVFSLSEVRDLYLEPGGTISIKKHAKMEPPTAEALNIGVDDEAPSILLIDEGKIKKENLQNAGKSNEWLQDALKREGYPLISDIYVAEWSPTNGFFIKTYEDYNG
ncbi:DUF421 domain-containing protein [Lederbergia wuyishanensis]|uniref:Uncharacterized membrane protein YcaP (DUF421 family) n=1 Tax=Lederbergia wuyishanensis TaxID=1347903 RepID=A0ABU0DAC0_9BACI|nr:DUF421 domain-containing protein [Lederbergia wuyishanensis]MCJ8009964.1 DUF421 domain-containing protein [Lederbergia wuyishanensis]MDQ0345312.1 uncharacterized membrane protein YcaP (DUF421 family) [Lederbergia wuyishanensis]